MKKIFAILTLSLLALGAYAQEAQKATSADYGYKQTGFMSTPKLGAYIIGSYKYSDLAGANGGPGFGARLIRAYVDGSIFGDFKYRLQVQLASGTPHVKDYFIEWAKYKEFSVKVGQFKRAFTFENPMNPWDVGVGDFSFLVKKFAGFGDRLDEDNMGGRDQGIQFQGDLIPMGDGDSYRLIHYQIGMWNGQGINQVDANKDKDIIATLQVQPIKGLYLGVFGWKGSWVKAATTTYTVAPDGTVTGNKKPAEELARRRLSAGFKFDRDNWTVRAEYAAAVFGEKQQILDAGRPNYVGSDAVYVTVGVPLYDWLKVYVKWDEYRAGATAATSHDMYSCAANFRLHKNLMFQLEYRRNENQLLPTPGYNEIWFQTYIRW